MAELRKYAVQDTVKFPMIKAATRDFAVAADWTPAQVDAKYSIDGGALATCTNTIAIGVSGAAHWTLTLTTAELTGKKIVVQVVDAATKAVEDQCIYVETYGNASAQHAFDLNDADPSVDVTKWNGTAVATPATAGYPVVTHKVGTGTGELALLTGGVKLTLDGMDAVLVSEPSGVPDFSTGTVRTAIAWIFALSRNKMTQSSTTQTLRNNADAANLATAAHSDDGTTYTRGKWA